MLRQTIEAYRSCIETIMYIATQNGTIMRRADLVVKTDLQKAGRTNPSEKELKDLRDNARNRLSREIKAVEAEFGVTLAKEVRKGIAVKLTPESVPFVRRLEEHVRAYEAITQEFRETVRISAIDAAVNFWIPVALRNRHRTKERPNIICVTREWWEVFDDVRKGYADFGIGPSMPCDSLLEDVMLRRPHIAVFSKAAKRLAVKKTIGVEDFVEHGAICLHSFAKPVAVESNLPPEVRIIRVNTSAQAAAWADQGLGIALLTEDLVPRGGGSITRPVAFETIEAVDSLYRPKRTKNDTDESKRNMSKAASADYDAIAAYWKMK